MLPRELGKAWRSDLREPRLKRGDRRLVLLLGGLLLLQVLVNRLQLRQELIMCGDGLVIGMVVDHSTNCIGQGADRSFFWVLPFRQLLDLFNRAVVGSAPRLPVVDCLLDLGAERGHVLAERFGVSQQAVDGRLGLGRVGGIDLLERILVARHERLPARGQWVLTGTVGVDGRVLQMFGHGIHCLLERILQVLRLRIRAHLGSIGHTPLLLQTAAHDSAFLKSRNAFDTGACTATSANSVWSIARITGSAST